MTPVASKGIWRDLSALIAANGYLPVPVRAGQKAAIPDDWPDYRFAKGDELKPGWGNASVGIITHNVIAVDIDVRVPEVAEQLHKLASEMLGHAPSRVGAAPKLLLLYRIGFDVIPKQKTRLFDAPDAAPGDKPQAVEVLGKGQQFVAFGIHPDTQKPYQWNGTDDPTNVPVAGLIPVELARVKDFIAAADRTLVDAGFRPRGKLRDEDERKSNEVAERLNPHSKSDTAQLTEALNFVDADAEDCWSHVGWILGRLFFQSDEGFAIFDKWAARSPKYDAKGTKDHYYKGSQQCRTEPMTSASIFQWAKEGGYKLLIEWSKPLNVFSEFNAPPLTADDVPEVIGAYATLLARVAGFDPTATISAGVAAAAACTDDGFRLCLSAKSKWYASARLWIALVGDPGRAKTPAQQALVAPIHAAHMLMVENAKEGEPRKALFTSDVTVEKLSDLLRDNPRGILIHVDELESWLGSHDAYRSGAGSKDRGHWLAAYDGGPNQIDRVQRGSVFVSNWGVSLLAATTPAVLKKLSKKLPNDGLLQRFMLFAVEKTAARDKSVSGEQIADARNAYETHLDALLHWSASKEDRAANVVSMTIEALEEFEKEEARLRELVDASGSLSDAFGAHVSKHIGMLTRLIITFHAVSVKGNPTEQNVSVSTVRLAARFMRKVYQHGLSVYTEVFSGSSALELAQAIARSILASGLTSFNSTELTNVCRAFRGVEHRDQLAALYWLRDMGWIAGAAGYGARWNVNPEASELYAAEGEEHRARRAAVREALLGRSEV